MAGNYGVTAEGFIRMRLPEIRVAIIEELRANLRARALPDDIETRPDSVLGVLIDTFAERETALWELSEGVYYSMYPGSAFGVALDRATSFAGVKRLVAERSQAYVTAYGTQGTVIPAGSQIRHRVTQNLWRTTVGLVIGAGAASDVAIVPVTVANSTTYTVTLDAITYSYTSGSSGTTVNSILIGLVNALSQAPMAASQNGASLRLVSTTKISTSITHSANLAFSTVGSAVLAETIEPMAEAVVPGDLNAIVSMVDGWASVNNLASGSVGRREETDSELRARYATGVFRFGASILPSIAPNIVARVPGVTAIRVFENSTDVVDAEGRLPHSIHVVVDGGVDDVVARAIYDTKAAGIDTNGSVLRSIETDEGVQAIRFDRPAPIWVWVKAAITPLPTHEGIFPVGGIDRVRAALLAMGEKHSIGQDVVWQRFIAAVYETPGIASVALTFGTSATPGGTPGAYTAANITVPPASRAMFSIDRIQVT
jgi:uncharacterized phage protein gp47/JayE